MKIKVLGITLTILFIAFVTYGLLTDCPNTATYVYCGF